MTGVSASGTARLDRWRRSVSDWGSSDRFLVTAPEDVRWLSGFTGSNGWLVVGPESVVLLTDGRYVEQARMETTSVGVEAEVLELSAGQSMADLVALALPGAAPDRGRRLIFQPNGLTVGQFRTIEAAVGPILEPSTAESDSVRRIKDPDEIATIARAAEIADRALEETLPLLWGRPTERDVRDELEFRLRRLGADGPSYDTIVAAGPVNSAKPHHRPGGTVIEPGHAVVIDVGALLDGYHSDMTRTYFVGDVDPELRKMFDLVRVAQATAVSAVRPGVTTGSLDAICRDIFREAGTEDLFIHGTGHGVGLAIHEEPYVGRGGEVPLMAGDVVTIEPGLYRVGLGGVRIEDLLVVEGDAHRCLTNLPKDSPCPPSPQMI